MSTNYSVKVGAVTANPGVADWEAIIRDPRFRSSHRRRTAFLRGLMSLSVVYYSLLPILGFLLTRDRRSEDLWSEAYVRRNTGRLVSRLVAIWPDNSYTTNLS